jgi:hypothetical protein
MTTPRKYRWGCGGGHPGVLAPGRLRRNDVRRFCWPCSLAAGVLVERTSAALERKRDAAKETRRRKASRKAATRKRARDRTADEKRRRREFFDAYARFYRRACRLKAWEVDLAKRPPGVFWGISSDGCARGRGSRNRVGLDLGVGRAGNLELILHELAHAAYEGHRPGFPKIPGEHRYHNGLFRTLLCDAVEEITGTNVAGRTTGEADREATKALSAWLRSDDCWWTPPSDELERFILG